MIEPLERDCESQNEAIAQIAVKVDEIVDVLNIVLKKLNIDYQDET